MGSYSSQCRNKMLKKEMRAGDGDGERNKYSPLCEIYWFYLERLIRILVPHRAFEHPK